MPSQLRINKRAHSQVDSGDELQITRSQPLRRLPTKPRQSTLSFSQPATRDTTTPTPGPSSTPSQISSIYPSESASRLSTVTARKILSTRRIYFEVDCSNLEGLGSFRVKARTMRSIGGKSKISWTYLHRIELEKKDKDKWIRHWLYKQCYDQGSPKPMPSASTSSCSEHLQKKHKILPPGCSSTETTASIEPFVGEQYHLQAER
jgi:hypothetical protein